MADALPFHNTGIQINSTVRPYTRLLDKERFSQVTVPSDSLDWPSVHRSRHREIDRCRSGLISLPRSQLPPIWSALVFLASPSRSWRPQETWTRLHHRPWGEVFNTSGDETKGQIYTLKERGHGRRIVNKVRYFPILGKYRLYSREIRRVSGNFK